MEISKEPRQLFFTSPLPVKNGLDNNLAELEHASFTEIPLTCSLQEIRIRISGEAAWYFYFLRAVIALNFLLGLLSLVTFFVDYYIFDNKKLTIYLSNYNYQSKVLWQVISILSIIVGIIFPFAYRYITFYTKENDRNSVEDPFEGMYAIKGKDCIDRIEYKNGDPSLLKRTIGVFSSILCFIMIMILQVYVNYTVEKLTMNYGVTITSLLLSVALVGFNFIWQMLCILLSIMECHLYMSIKARSDFIKIFLYQFISSILLLCMRETSTIFDQNDPMSLNICPMEIIGNTVLLLIIIEGTLGNIFLLIGPYAHKIILRNICYNKDHSDATLPIFMASQEYVMVLYRQLLIMLAIPLIQFVGFLGILIDVIKYGLDKYKLLRITHPAIRNNNTYVNIIIVLWSLMILSCFFMYPSGNLWILYKKSKIILENVNVNDCPIFY